MTESKKGFDEIFRERELVKKADLTVEGNFYTEDLNKNILSWFYLLAYYKKWKPDDFEIDSDYKFSLFFTTGYKDEILQNLVGQLKPIIIPVPNQFLLYKNNDGWCVVYLNTDSTTKALTLQKILLKLKDILTTTDNIDLTPIEVYLTKPENNLSMLMYMIAVIQFDNSDIKNSSKVLTDETFSNLLEKMKSLYELRYKVDTVLSSINASQEKK
jgi:hypothetical protein